MLTVMSMDSLTLDALVRELDGVLRGAAVSQVHQPGADELVLRLWTGRDNRRLLLSAVPGAGYLYLTDKKLPNPQTPPRFCQLLRARLGRLLKLERLPGERLVQLHFSGDGERRWTLVAELFGRRPNLILLDAEQRVVDALHRQEWESHPVLPGIPYAPPPTSRKIELGEFPPELSLGGDLEPWLLDQVSPMAPLLAAELAQAVACGESLAAYLRDFLQEWRRGTQHPCLLSWRGQRHLSSFVPAFVEVAEVQCFTTLSAAAEVFYGRTTAGAVFGGSREELLGILSKARSRLEKRLQKIQTEGVRMADFERQRQLGDLLLANLHRLHRGMTEATLDDWYAEPPVPVSIPLDPAKSPQENAEDCFRRQRKGKRGLVHVERRLRETREELDWLDTMLLAVEEAVGAGELQALRQELASEGLLQATSPAARKPPLPAADAGLRQTRSPSGLKIVWGRNNRSNDLVSRQWTGAEDLWFHAHCLPGCHLVLKRDGRREIPEEDLRYAAALAAGYSRGRYDQKVEVLVAEGRSVRKPKGARPGLVTAEPFRTLVVAPLRLSEKEP